MSKSGAALDIFKNYFHLMIVYRLQTLGSKDEAPALTSPSSFFSRMLSYQKKRSRRNVVKILQNQTCPRNTIKLFLKLETSWMQRLNPREFFRFYKMSNERSIFALSILWRRKCTRLCSKSQSNSKIEAKIFSSVKI